MGAGRGKDGQLKHIKNKGRKKWERRKKWKKKIKEKERKWKRRDRKWSENEKLPKWNKGKRSKQKERKGGEIKPVKGNLREEKAITIEKNHYFSYLSS